MRYSKTRLIAVALAAWAALCSPTYPQVIISGGSSGGGRSGDITAVTAGAGLSGGGTTGAVTLAAKAVINAQTGTIYTIDATDAAKLVTFSNGSTIAVTLPQATGPFAAGFSFGVQNKGAGTVTITPTTSTINGAATLTIAQDRGCWITSDGTHWQVDSCTALVSGGSVAVGSITGLASNMATWLATSSSANLASTVTDETGNGALFFAGGNAGVFTGTTLALNGCTITGLALCTTGNASLGGDLTLSASADFIFSGRGRITSPGSNFITMGGDPSSSPQPYSIGFQNGNGANIAGQNSTIVGSLGTGSASSGSILFTVGGAVGGSGTTLATGGEVFRVEGVTQKLVMASGKKQNWPAITPVSSSDTCSAGDIQRDADYLYVCTASNTFKRVALSTF